MARFGRTRGGISVHFEEHEADLLRQLLDEMATLLEVGIEADPVNKRLFPEAYESAEDSQSYKDLIGDELRTGKIEALKGVKEAIGDSGEVSDTISEDEAAGWLPVLTDIRLAIGTRNDVTEEKMAADPDPDDPDASAMLGAALARLAARDAR